jgi:hypothetical protein
MSQRPVRLLSVVGLGVALAAVPCPTATAFSPPAPLGGAQGHAMLFGASVSARPAACLMRRKWGLARMASTLGMESKVEPTGAVLIDSEVTPDDPVKLVRSDMKRLKTKIKEVQPRFCACTSAVLRCWPQGQRRCCAPFRAPRCARRATPRHRAPFPCLTSRPLR